MQLPSDLSTWFHVVGALAAGLGSLLLAWRVSQILKWVVYCLVAHERSIDVLINVAGGKFQSQPAVTGVIQHVLDIESKLGVALLVAGLVLLGLGMLSNAASFLF